MTAYAIAGLSTSCIGPPQIEHGPFDSEEAATIELARLRTERKIHATNSVVYQLPDTEETP